MHPFGPGPDGKGLFSKAEEFARSGRIDPVADLADDRVYLFSGEADDTVTTRVVDQTLTPPHECQVMLLRSIRAPAGSVNARCRGQAALADAAFFMVAASTPSARIPSVSTVQCSCPLAPMRVLGPADSNAPTGIDGLGGGRDSTLERPRVTPQYPSLGCT